MLVSKAGVDGIEGLARFFELRQNMGEWRQWGQVLRFAPQRVGGKTQDLTPGFPIRKAPGLWSTCVASSELARNMPDLQYLDFTTAQAVRDEVVSVHHQLARVLVSACSSQ